MICIIITVIVIIIYRYNTRGAICVVYSDSVKYCGGADGGSLELATVDGGGWQQTELRGS